MRAVGQDGVEDADDLDLDDLGERNVEHAGVLALVGIEEDVAAAGNDAGIDRDAEAVGRLEAASRDSAGPRLPPWSGKAEHSL